MSDFRLPPFTVLTDEDDRTGLSLTPDIQKIYGGDWVMPRFADRPYVVSNFVVARDGRVSYALPGQSAGGEVAGPNLHDRWIMGLLRARADAVVMGDNTLIVEPEHLWVPEFICPEGGAAFDALRKAEKRRTVPIQCFVSLRGSIDKKARVFNTDYPTTIATTAAGAANARLAGLPKHVEIIEMGKDIVDLRKLFRYLQTEHDVNDILSEGGPGLNAHSLNQGVIDDEFLTLSPRYIGENPGNPRPSLLEGCGFTPDTSPLCQMKSLRKVGDFLYLHAKIQYPKQ